MRALWIGTEHPAATRLADAATPAGGIEVVRARELASGLSELAGGGIDVVLIELARRTEDLDALSMLHSRMPDVPVVALTSPDDDALGPDAVQRGAQDWLVSTQADNALLTRALRYAIERHRLQRTLRELSLTDDLTGLYNRRGFLTLCDHHLKLARRTRGLLLARADIAGLKAINVAHGFDMGDRALRDAAEILRATFRVSDVIARLAGDEFAILAPDAADETANVIVPRLREQLEMYNARGEPPAPLAIRIGIARCARDETTSTEELLARASIALADQKR